MWGARAPTRITRGANTDKSLLVSQWEPSRLHRLQQPLHACEHKGVCVCVCVRVCVRVLACERERERKRTCLFSAFFFRFCTCMFACKCCTSVCVCTFFFTSSQTRMAFNFEWRQMLRWPILRQWKEPFLSTYRSMSSHSIRKSETISTWLMTPFWKAGELWPRGRRAAGGGARESISAGWGISLTAFIMSAIHFFSVLSSNTYQIAYCGMLLNVPRVTF